MTDLATGGAGAAPDSDWGDQPINEVKSLFNTLGKAFRAYQLYDANNPVRQRFVDSLRTEFAGLWQLTDRLVLRVTEDHFMLGEASVYHTEQRADSLAFLFFKDSVREVTFLPGVEGDELVTFLGVLQEARKLVPEGDDLLTVLWDADLDFFKYQYIDLLAEGVSLPEAGPGNSPAEIQAALQGAAEEENEGAPESGQAGAAAEEEEGPKTVSKDDFNPTLYQLDPAEMRVLAGELKKELARDLRGDVLLALFDRLEEPQNRKRQSEVLDILRGLLPSFLSRGQVVAATQVLKELNALEEKEGMLDEQRVAEARQILDEISTPQAIEELIRALYDGTIRASPKQLGTFLQFLRVGAMEALLRSSETVDHKELQAVLRQAVQGIADVNRDAVVKMLDQDDPIVAAGAARLAGEMRIAEAGPGIAALLSHPDPTVRMASIEAAISLGGATAAGELEQTLSDPVRDIRIAAARALAELKQHRAADALADLIRGKDIRAADISEKVAFFEAYGLVARAQGVALLEQLLNGKGFLRKREPSEVRAAAAHGLAKIANQAARTALEQATEDDDPVVRSAVSRALRTET